MTTSIFQTTPSPSSQISTTVSTVGKVPEVWTDVFIGPVPKPAKDHKCLKGHRIIVVQNVVGKIPEKIAARRFTRHFECVLPPGMSAYSPHR